MSNEINVYWAPAQFNTTNEQWNLLYSEPKAVADNLVLNPSRDNQIIRCPATREALRNVFSIHSNVEDVIDLKRARLDQVAQDSSSRPYPLSVSSKVTLTRVRPSSFEGYVNLHYNIAWLMFADEPLVVKMTAPYYPVVTPTTGALMTSGEFDIGQWYRPINLDYHVPTTAEKFEVRSEDPLAFFEFKTNKTLKFHRYKLTPYLDRMAGEFINSPKNYGSRKSLLDRYKMAKAAGVRELILSEIQKNLV